MPGFEEAVRRYAVLLLSLAYRKVKVETVGESLKLEGAELAAQITKLCEAEGWKRDEADDQVPIRSYDRPSFPNHS